MYGSFRKGYEQCGLKASEISEAAQVETVVAPQAGKRTYLGIICHNLDDLPVMIDDAEHNVRRYLETLNVEVISDQVAAILELDGSTTPIAAKIVTFENGKPISSEIVRHFEETREHSPDLQQP
jgi:hypothetical protein